MVFDHDQHPPSQQLLRHRLLRSLSSKFHTAFKSRDPPSSSSSSSSISAQMNGIRSSSSADILEMKALENHRRVPSGPHTRVGCFANGEIVLRNTHRISRELPWNGVHRKYGVLDAESLQIVDDDDGGGSSCRWNVRNQCGCFARRIVDHHRNRMEQEMEMRKGDKKTQRNHYKRTGEAECYSGLDDDVVEMCLAKASFSTVMSSRIVCRKWRALTMSTHFMATREKLGSKKPWLFLFGISRDGISSREIHALDIASDRWHSIQTDKLRGRSLFSVVCLNSLVYIIGGCSNMPSSNSAAHDNKSSTKTHKGVMVFDPFTCSWTKCRSMGVARAMAIAAVFELRHIAEVTTSSSTHHDQKLDYYYSYSNLLRSGRSYDDLRSGRSLADDDDLRSGRPLTHYDVSTNTSTTKLKNAFKEHHSRDRTEQNCGLIVVGGRGIWKEALFSAEIYNPVSDTWREIAKLPSDHGVTSAGVVCNGFFYAYSESDKLAAYDFRFNTWSNIQITNSLVRLHEYVPKLVCCNGRLILLGVTWGTSARERSDRITGHDNVEAATRTLWELDPSSQTWQQICKHPDAPLDWNAVSVSENNQIYGIEMFKILGQVVDFVTVCDISSSEVSWKRMSRLRLGHNLDVSSWFAKSAVMVQL